MDSCPRQFRMLMTMVCFALVVAGVAGAQQSPYFVTYDHHLEEPGNLEIATEATFGLPHAPQRGYAAPFAEFEYGTRAWWTTEFYLEGQSTRGDSAVFTGWRLENRFRPLLREHAINPVLYVEYESINEASRIRKEIVGHAEPGDEPNDVLRKEHAHELEGKLILSSTVHDWNIAENFVVEKNLTENEGVEFGYAFGLARPLARMASGRDCRFCRENFAAGIELYGGLGSTEGFGLRNTAHYIAPILSWQVSDNSNIHISPAFGLTHLSDRVLLRVGYSYEIEGFGTKIAALFGRK